MNHRTKNTLATIQSIVTQSARTSNSEDLAQVINQRIEALAGANDVLTGRRLDRARLLETVARALKPFRAEGGRINILGREDVEISGSANTALTMALHELATNAVKYGALSNESGHIDVDWKTDGSDFCFVWKEHGGPQVVKPTRSGFGSRMIERALAASFSGTAKIDFLPEGIRFELRTKIDKLTEDS
jgi:two-component sensor histidine kinase